MWYIYIIALNMVKCKALSHGESLRLLRRFAEGDTIREICRDARVCGKLQNFVRLCLYRGWHGLLLRTIGAALKLRRS